LRRPRRRDVPEAFVQVVLECLHAEVEGQRVQAVAELQTAFFGAQQDTQDPQPASGAVKGVDGFEQPVRHQPAKDLGKQERDPEHLRERRDDTRHRMPATAGQQLQPGRDVTQPLAQTKIPRRAELLPVLLTDHLHHMLGGVVPPLLHAHIDGGIDDPAFDHDRLPGRPPRGGHGRPTDRTSRRRLGCTARSSNNFDPCPR
jgi:hypothetical protein